MERWNTGAVTALALLLGVVLGSTLTAMAWGQSSAIGDFLWRWQTLVAASVAAGAAFIAWFNVSRQLRVTLLTREEDRIERLLPGLEEAAMNIGRWHLDFWLALQDDAEIMKVKTFRISGNADSLAEEVSLTLPNTDERTRLRIAQALRLILFRIERLRNELEFHKQLATTTDYFEDQMDELLWVYKQGREHDLNGARHELRMAVQDLSSLESEIFERTRRYRTLLPVIRRHIDTFFGRGH